MWRTELSIPSFIGPLVSGRRACPNNKPMHPEYAYLRARQVCSRSITRTYCEHSLRNRITAFGHREGTVHILGFQQKRSVLQALGKSMYVCGVRSYATTPDLSWGSSHRIPCELFNQTVSCSFVFLDYEVEQVLGGEITPQVTVTSPPRLIHVYPSRLGDVSLSSFSTTMSSSILHLPPLSSAAFSRPSSKPLIYHAPRISPSSAQSVAAELSRLSRHADEGSAQVQSLGMWFLL
ncbi:hypothetical protein C2E23DRAFT_567070 [Lenzites betulinus]|nr:hypothetical protein C2E23DRAFT_567070 [Lenzites betulinus]